jgi:transcriptional regulator with XRE-family HTH domain
MKAKKISQVEICEKLGLTKNNFTDWKADRSRSYMKYIFQIADILGVSVDYLKGESDVTEKLQQGAEVSDRDFLVLKAFNSLTVEQQESLLQLMITMRERH